MISVLNDELPSTIRISSRQSDLAKIQSITVGNKIKELYPNIEIKYHFRESLGDKNLENPLWKMPEKGVFTEDFYLDLVNHNTDMVVHSWKDLPTETKPDTVIFSTLNREDQRDILLIKKKSIDNHNSKLKIFTSSPRRSYNLDSFLKKSLPIKLNEIQFLSVRGNIQTRIKKLIDNNEIDGLILAKAALDRLLSVQDEQFSETKLFIKRSLQELRFQVLPLSLNPTAAAQGAIAIEVNRSNKIIQNLLNNINNKNDFENVTIERDELKKYGGGCHQKIGISIFQKDEHKVLFLKGFTDSKITLDQSRIIKNTCHPYPRFSKSLDINKTILTNRESLNCPEFLNAQNNFLFFTKWDSFNDLHQSDQHKVINNSNIVWTSGIQTWFKLAESGVFVTGSFDSLGEESKPQIENLVEGYNEKKWLKITHEKGIQNSWSQLVSVYKIKYDFSKLSDLNHIECYYWSSSELFKEFMTQFPINEKQFHACGLGSTLETLKQYIPTEKILVFYNQEEWKQKCLI